MLKLNLVLKKIKHLKECFVLYAQKGLVTLWKKLSPPGNPVKAKTFIGFAKPKQQQKT